MIRKTTNKDELFGIAYRYAYNTKRLTTEQRDAFLQGAKYVIKHLPEEWKQTVVTTKKMKQ